MNEFKGTPGPWLYRGKSDSVHVACETHPYGKQIFQFKDGYNGEDLPSDADLALVLAAPDLLAALQGVLRVADRATDEFDAARAAIAKATSNSN